MIVNPIVCCTIQIKNGIMKHVNVSVIVIVHAKMIIVRILPRAFVGMFSVNKSIADTFVSARSEIISATDNMSTNVTNTIPTNMTNTISTIVTSTMSTDSKVKKQDINCYILHTVWLVII